MQRGDIAVTEEYFRVGANTAIVQQRQQSSASVTAPQAPDRLHAPVLEHSHEISRSVSVAAGQKAPTLPNIGCEPNAKSQAFKSLHRPLEHFGVRRSTGRGDD